MKYFYYLCIVKGKLTEVRSRRTTDTRTKLNVEQFKLKERTKDYART